MNLADSVHAGLAQIDAIAVGAIAQDALRVDREGHYPRDNLAALGAAGAYSAHMRTLPDAAADYGFAIDAMASVSRHCGSTGFLVWCQDVCGLYLEESGNAALRDTLQSHANGATLGGTALSNPMKYLAGIEKMLLQARRVPGGYRVSGALPWVSHIAPGQYCGAIAAVTRDDGSVSHEIMFLLRIGEGVTLRPCPEFSGMEGTSTWGLRVDDLFVDEQTLIADPARPFIARVRAAFILLQTGMALGLVQGSLDDIAAVEPLLGHVNRFLHDRPDELVAEADDLKSRIVRLARTPFDGSNDYLIDVLDARAHGAELALKATQSALLHQGARGYLMQSAPQRRIREAHFVAIVTPAIKHLRWEMDRISREITPASAA